MGGNGQRGDFYDWRKLTLRITNRCNLRCKMCSFVHGERDTLPREVALHCADFALRRGFREVEVTGGEPTLIDYFWDLLDRLCAAHSAEIMVTTNGATLTEDEIATFASYPDLRVQVSIDGIGATHDGIRGVAGAFGRTAENLEALAKAGCHHLSINTVVQRANLAELPETYARFKHLPLRFHAFSLIEGGGDWRDQMFEPHDWPQVMRVLRQVKQEADRDGREVILSDALLKAFGLRVRYPHFIVHPGLGCTVVRKGLIVTPEGHALPCWNYPWAREDSRSVYHRTLDDIVDAPEVRAELSRAAQPLGCRGCSTMCYNWDEEFREKVMRPSGKLLLRRKALCGIEEAKLRFPGALHLFRRIKHRFGLPNPPGFAEEKAPGE